MERLKVAEQKAALAKERKLPPAPRATLTPEEWQDPMYFTEPSQLLEIFTQLEEQNLFLIQNAQETEEQLEEIKVKFRETKKHLDGETSVLQEQINHLESAIETEKQRVTQLMGRAAANDSSFQTTGIPLETLHEKVKEVFERCLGEKEGQLDTISMLKAIEVQMERYLSEVSDIPTEFLVEEEKAREKARRHVMRERKMLEQAEERALKAKKALERAYKPVPKIMEKPKMFRSVLPKKKEKKQEEKQDVEEIMLAQFLENFDDGC